MGLIYLASILAFWGVIMVKAEDGYKYYNWTVTYAQASPLGTPQQQVIHINGTFPGPTIECVTNDNIIVNVYNNLDVPFLLTWNGIKQRKTSWQDGVLGTNCPIPPGKNFTYKFQTKDQIGSYTYFPSNKMERAAGGFGALNVYARSVIKVPYDKPAGDFTLLIGDWYNNNHTALQDILDKGETLPDPIAILINGQSGLTFRGDPGKTYMFRVSNIGLATNINFRIQSHQLKLVEVEGCHVNQTMYESLDVYVGQTLTVLVTLDQTPSAYYIVASSTFAKMPLHTTAVLNYTTGNVSQPVGWIPTGPDGDLDWSMKQARSIRWDRTANAARPNPQGSYDYSNININRTITLENSAPLITGRQIYAVNKISYIIPETPLKLADFFKIPKVFKINFPQNASSAGPDYWLNTSVLGVSLHEFVEIVFQNNEETLQTWHLDGYDFWVIGMGIGQWTPANRRNGTNGYNLWDAYTRHTLQSI
ncbi:l-ascorbate oxidase homolog [Phtheirospermum japonicum]|uniref:L-ascorbate oxidase homolog n=1 Tax=Phtheirospermum japonicum TaxID=374723 RepID=A0A830CUP6_9LAMI|nr:l-ascorbate oxidase homolog [Phtheirospermum japonicum]